jgi:hypothetical protein
MEIFIYKNPIEILLPNMLSNSSFSCSVMNLDSPGFELCTGPTTIVWTRI